MDEGDRDLDYPDRASGLRELEDVEVEVEDVEVEDTDVVEDIDVVELESLSRLPTAANASVLVRSRWIASPGVQAAAAAATGFVAGAATLALARRLGVRRIAAGAAAAGQGAESLRPATHGPFSLGPGQTYVVHVRVLTPRAPE